MDILKVGDIISVRGNFGRQAPRDLKVNTIEVNCINKQGTVVNEVEWSNVSGRTVIVSLDDDTWAYGNQISKKE